MSHTPKAARLLILREVLADWPDCPTRFAGEALGVDQRTIQRDLHDLQQIDRLAGQLRVQVSEHRDPDWVSDDDVIGTFGWSATYLPALARRLPESHRLLYGHRLWHVPSLLAYLHDRPLRGRRGPIGRRRLAT